MRAAWPPTWLTHHQFDLVLQLIDALERALLGMARRAQLALLPPHMLQHPRPHAVEQRAAVGAPSLDLADEGFECGVEDWHRLALGLEAPLERALDGVHVGARWWRRWTARARPRAHRRTGRRRHGNCRTFGAGGQRSRAGPWSAAWRALVEVAYIGGKHLGRHLFSRLRLWLHQCVAKRRTQHGWREEHIRHLLFERELPELRLSLKQAILERVDVLRRGLGAWPHGTAAVAVLAAARRGCLLSLLPPTVAGKRGSTERANREAAIARWCARTAGPQLAPRDADKLFQQNNSPASWAPVSSEFFACRHRDRPSCSLGLSRACRPAATRPGLLLRTLRALRMMCQDFYSRPYSTSMPCNRALTPLHSALILHRGRWPHHRSRRATCRSMAQSRRRARRVRRGRPPPPLPTHHRRHRLPQATSRSCGLSTALSVRSASSNSRTGSSTSRLPGAPAARPRTRPRRLARAPARRAPSHRPLLRPEDPIR